MHEFDMPLLEAMEWIEKRADEVKTKFLDRVKHIPSWGEQVDAQVAEYIDQMGNFIYANNFWSFESARYFGSVGLEVQKTRYVPLLPKAEQNEDRLGWKSYMTVEDVCR